VSDPELEAIRRFGILNEASGKIPHPTAVVVDREGTIRWIRVDVDYTKRPSPDELLAAIDGLGRAD
jgi:peroxiredoxin